MADRKTIMSWLEGLAQDDWAEWHSDSEVQTTAQAALGIGQERILVNVSMEKVERNIAITSHKERNTREG